MALWFTSDHHFFHNNIIRFSDRPFNNLDEMHEALIENWNKRVKPREHVYVLGDFCFGGPSRINKITPRLNGHKILIKGNHDKPAHVMLANGFDEVYENTTLKVGDHRVYLSHFPYHPVHHYVKTENDVYMEQHEYADSRRFHNQILDDGKTYLFHGHTHSKDKKKGRMIHVGVDAWGMAPASHEQLLELIDE